MADVDLDALGFDPELQRHEATVDVDGTAVAVRVAPEALEDRARTAETLAAVTRESGRLLDEAADDLLEDKNDEWLSDGEEPLSREDLRRRLTLDAIEVDPEGGVELVLGDDGMFWGHAVTVSLDSAQRITRVNLEG